MKDGKRLERHEKNICVPALRPGSAGNIILTLAVMAVNVFLMGICFDFYYDLNDDTMMHDIMAGIYTGTPDGHNMQTLYPLGALIALCYRLCRPVPWYGLFLCLCQFGSFYLVGVRLCECLRPFKKAVWKLLALVGLSLYMWGVCLPHLINIQYTVTCAVMSAAAVFLFLTTPEGLDPGKFLRWNIPSVLLVVGAFQLRSEMLLLTFPFICLAGLYRLAGEKKIFVKENLYRYGGVLGIILAGMALSSIADHMAYGSEEWKEFRDFFDARTTVYDFYPELVTDEAYGETLTELGVAPYRQTLLRNYNFGLDDKMDAEALAKLADHATGKLGAAKDWKGIAHKAARDYIYRTFHGGDAPYNFMVLLAYGAVLVAGLYRRRMDRASGDMGIRGAGIWQLLLLAAVRSALWMFILLRGRDPERITHSLYLVESALLTGMFVWTLLRSGGKSGIRFYGKRDDSSDEKGGNRSMCGAPVLRGMLRGMMALGLIFMLISLTRNVTYVRADQSSREQANRNWHEIDDYCRTHGEKFYFEDVYSTVAFSQKLFADRDNSYANYDILGGWMCKSPLYREKLSLRGIDSAEEALLAGENVYLIMSDREVREQGFEWITAYYNGLGKKAEVEKTDAIGSTYGVYRIMENGLK